MCSFVSRGRVHYIGFLLLALLIGSQSSRAQPAGQWTNVLPLPSIPIAAALLADGRVLGWSSNSLTGFELDIGATPSQTFTSLTTPQSVLTAPSTTTAGGNGVFANGGTSTTGIFPTNTFLDANYWADVVFQPATSLFSESNTPASLNENEGQPVEVGVKFQSSVAGQITALKFYRSPSDTGSDLLNLWDSTGNNLASVTFTNTAASGWQSVSLATPVTISANTTYVASYHTSGRFAKTANFFTTAAF